MKIGKHLTILNSKDIKELMKLLNEQFGVEEKLDFVFLKNNKDKVYIINREIEELDFEKLWVDSVGLYLGKFHNDGFRPSVEGAQILAPFATKNVIEVSKEQKHEWLKGNDIDLPSSENKFVIVKSEDDVLGAGKVKNEVILNSVPKARRLFVVNESI